MREVLWCFILFQWGNGKSPYTLAGGEWSNEKLHLKVEETFSLFADKKWNLLTDGFAYKSHLKLHYAWYLLSISLNVHLLIIIHPSCKFLQLRELMLLTSSHSCKMIPNAYKGHTPKKFKTILEPWNFFNLIWVHDVLSKNIFFFFFSFSFPF